MASTTLPAKPAPAPRTRSQAILIGGFPLMALLFLIVLLGSAGFGALRIENSVLWDSVTSFDATNTEHLVIHNLRLPRALTAALVGSALAIAGGVMQGLTRNPLADSGLLGIESGAALAVLTAVLFLDLHSLSQYALYGFFGAAVTGAVVYMLGSVGRGGPTPFKLTIAGAAVSALLGSLTTLLALMHPLGYNEVRFWMAGTVGGREIALIGQAAIYILIGLGIAILIGRQITTLSLGDDVARGLGQNVFWAKLLSALAVVVLAGTSVALAGPIGFVGLVVPHVVRFFVGVDYRWILPYSALVGAMFMIIADVVGRVVLRPTELPVGIMTAAIGGPIFIYLVRTRMKR
jgi:iron complex transport system permease protein